MGADGLVEGFLTCEDRLFFQFYYRRRLAFFSKAEALHPPAILILFLQQLRLRLGCAFWTVLGPQERLVADQKISVLGIHAYWFGKGFVLF